MTSAIEYSSFDRKNIAHFLFKYPQSFAYKGFSIMHLNIRKTTSYDFHDFFKNAETLYLSTFQQKNNFEKIWNDKSSIYICSTTILFNIKNLKT